MAYVSRNRRAPRAASKADSSIDMAGPLGPAIVNLACADGAQLDIDLDRDEISVFVPDGRRGRDSQEPALACRLDQWLGRIAAGDRERLRSRLTAPRSSSTRRFETQFRALASDGRQHWMDLAGIAVRDEGGVLTRIVAHQTRRASIEAEHASPMPSAYYDPLTGLANRRLFQNRLAEAASAAKTEEANPFAVFFIDLDRFKAINDRHGHLVGDQTLVAVAQRLAHCVRPGDVLARRDGDEFTVLLSDIGCQADAAAVAQRMLAQLASTLAVDATELRVTASIGIALSERDCDCDELLRRADEAMYRAKADGGGRFVMAGPAGMNDRVVVLLLSAADN